MPTPPVAVADFKAQFTREFVYGSLLSQINDSDIQRALNEATVVFNSDLWADNTEIGIAFLYAAAHYLTLNIQAAGGLQIANQGAGLNSRGGAAVQSKSVGNVSVAFAMPTWITENPILSAFLRTDYGQKYVQMLVPRLIGASFVVDGFDEDSAFLGVAPVVGAQQFLSTGNFDLDPTVATIEYMFIVMGTVESGARFLVPVSGTIKGLTLVCSSNTLNGATICTVLKNGVAQPLTANFSVGSVATQDPAHTFNVIANDGIDIKIDMSASSSGKLLGLNGSVILQTS